MVRSRVQLEVTDNGIFDEEETESINTIAINLYSSILRPAVIGAQKLAKSNSNYEVRVEHFVNALFSEAKTRNRLEERGYKDAEVQRELRYAKFAHPGGLGDPQPRVLPKTPRLQAWFDAAKEVAASREAEHHTITLDDFLYVIRGDAELPEESALGSIRKVMAGYHQDLDTPFSEKALKAIAGVRDDVANAQSVIRNDVNEARREIRDVQRAVGSVDSHVGIVDAHVGNLQTEVADFRDEMRISLSGVSTSVAPVRSGTIGLHDKADELLSRLPKEMSLAKFAAGSLIVTGMMAGALMGLLARWHFGVF